VEKSSGGELEFPIDFSFVMAWIMRQQEALTVLVTHQKTLESFGVKSLMLFGSVARDEGRIDSDVDLLVEFDRPVGLFAFVRLKRYLEEILEHPVDLGTPDSLKPDLQEHVFREAIRAF
jgi:predicted nucleotidyltransferase